MGLNERAKQAAREAERLAALKAQQPSPPNPEVQRARDLFNSHLVAWFEEMGVTDLPPLEVYVWPSEGFESPRIEARATWELEDNYFEATSINAGGTCDVRVRMPRANAPADWWPADTREQLGEALLQREKAAREARDRYGKERKWWKL